MRIGVNSVNARIIDSESSEVCVLVGGKVQKKFIAAKIDDLVSKIISRNPEIKNNLKYCFSLEIQNQI